MVTSANSDWNDHVIQYIVCSVLSKGHTIIRTWIGNRNSDWSNVMVTQYCNMSVVTCVGVCSIRVF